MAAEWAGFRTVGQCEWADYPTKVLEKHWPEVAKWRDIRTLTGDDFYAKTGIRTVDIISGGFPCQPFSVAGKQRGKEDDRFLWPEMVRVIKELRPTWVVGENVAGIINLALDDVLSDLEAEGYATRTFLIPACGVGAPHRRYRTAIVANASIEGIGGLSIQQRQSRQTSTDIIRGGKNVADTDSIGYISKETGKSNNDQKWNDTTSKQSKRPKLHAAVTGVCNTTSQGLPNRSSQSLGGSEPESEFKRPNRNGAEWWAIEPGLGRSYDGISCKLDGIGGMSDGAKARGKEILRNVREFDVKEALQWTIRRFSGISEEEILLAFLCEYEERSDRCRLEVESGATKEEFLRNLWRVIESSRSPHRREYKRQYAREYSDTLHSLSYQSPSLYSQAWINGCWESDITRVATNKANRVERLKCLGNAVVPQQFYPIFQAIADIELQNQIEIQGRGVMADKKKILEGLREIEKECKRCDLCGSCHIKDLCPWKTEGIAWRPPYEWKLPE